jgi:Lrp/AsnC family leucine-responsive transcriptional regulator
MLSEKDAALLSHLRRNGRETLTNISRLTKIPISTLYDRLKHQEKSIITKHTSLVDFSKIGYNTRVKIMIKVDRSKRAEVQKRLIAEPSVNSLYKINSGFDFMIDGIYHNVKELEEFLEKMEDSFEIAERQIVYIVEEIKREEFLAIRDN